MQHTLAVCPGGGYGLVGGRVGVIESPDMVLVDIDFDDSITDAARASLLAGEFRPLNDWKSALRSNMESDEFATLRPIISRIRITQVDMFGPRIGFVKMSVTGSVVDPRTHTATKLPGVVILRGPSVAMLIVIKSKDESFEPHVLLVEQPRLPIASLAFRELPAGMTDGEDNIAGVAAKELQEECGVFIKATDLKPLGPTRRSPGQNFGKEGTVFTSMGLLDEGIHYVYHELLLDSGQLVQLKNKHGGSPGEEVIKVKVVPLQDLLFSQDTKSIVAYTLYQHREVFAAADLLVA